MSKVRVITYINESLLYVVYIDRANKIRIGNYFTRLYIKV